MLDLSYERTDVSFFSDFKADVMNLTAASFSFDIKSIGQLPLCFIIILGIYILSSASVKYGCFNAYAADILNYGSFWSIFLSKSTSFGLSRSYSGPVNTKSHYLFTVIIYCPVFPKNKCLLNII